MPASVEKAMTLLHQSVVDSCFGCGLPYPYAVEGARILDLGSGTGRDVFLLSYLAGECGCVIGVDMTPTMLSKSRAMIPYHEAKFGFRNVTFLQGTLEDLDKVEGLENGSFDIIISNCVINLTADKEAVFRHAYNLLKPGGEMCFSDVFVDKTQPENVRKSVKCWNEGYGGALVWGEFLKIVAEIGFLPPFTMSAAEFAANDQEIRPLLVGLEFRAKTLRLFKAGVGKAPGRARYLGTLVDCARVFPLAKDLAFKVVSFMIQPIDQRKNTDC